jgi:hemerythrin-like metal-binding protein
MPNRIPWEARYAVGHDLIDTQHRGLLGQSNRLADLCLRGDDAEARRQFDEAFAAFKALVREHFEAEAALLAAGGCPDLDDHHGEHEEFEYLADEIVTTDNFSRLELQRFIALWCVGHIVGTAARQAPYLASAGQPD